MCIHRFTSNYIKSGSGFKLMYEPTNVAPSLMTNKTGECGGFFYTPNGVLTSPSYPDNYPSYSECIYIISQPTGTILRLNFLKLDIEWVSHCTFDFVDVRDGPSDMAWQRWPNMYCGNEIPAPFQSTVNHVWIM